VLPEVVDDADAPFASELARFGGVDRVGLPTSSRYWYGGLLTQAFQKLVLQWHPELGQVLPMNVLDELHAAGADAWLDTAFDVPASLDWSMDTGQDWQTIYRTHLALLDSYPLLRAAYLADPEAVTDYGLPMAVRDNGGVVVVRLQRAVLVLSTTDPAAPVEVVPGGTLAVAFDLSQQSSMPRGVLPGDAAAN
jgi:hypothetical protein